MQCAEAVVVVICLVLIALVGAELVRRCSREGYLVYPYIDLDEPGERGSYYQLMACQ